MPQLFSFLKSKKAMEMSLNTVIVAVIALLILGLMIFVLARNTDVFNKGTKCVTYGGQCVKEQCEQKNQITIDTKNPCVDSGSYCCSLVPGQGRDVDVENKQQPLP